MTDNYLQITKLNTTMIFDSKELQFNNVNYLCKKYVIDNVNQEGIYQKIR